MSRLGDFFRNNTFIRSVRSTIQPWWEPVNRQLEPLRRYWRGFAARNPRLAAAIRFLVRTGLVLALLMLLLISSMLLGIFGRVPSGDELRHIRTATASEAYSEDGVLLGRYFMENRTTVVYKDINPSIVHALVATEDARFFEHHGVDIRSMFRVLFKSVLMGDESSGGGSTLSQQLAKNLFKRQKFLVLSLPLNKIREIIIARRLEKIYSKEELLTLYLNTVPFGNNVFGIHMASMRYFNKPPANIHPEEAAVLIGMLKATTSYNPVKNPDKATQRRNTVLELMEKNNYLSKAVTDSLQKVPLRLSFNTERVEKDFAPYFREYIRMEVEQILKDHLKEDGSPYDLYEDGLRIYTTLNSKMQNYATEAIVEHLSSLQQRFDSEWGTREPWADSEATDFIGQEMRKSKRYKSLKEQGVPEAEIEKIFHTKIKMKVFTWKGTVEKEMSPLDSIKYYQRLLNAGFMVMESKTGAIKAWIGGTDFEYFQYDHVKSRRQVGSTFKPVLYARSLMSGISPCEFIPNSLPWSKKYQKPAYEVPVVRNGRVIEIQEWAPANADMSAGGSYRMADALRKSLNLVSANLITRDSVGPEAVKALAEQMGVTSPILAVPSLALGAAELSLYEMVQVYGTFANRGVRVKPMAITRITDADGNEIASFQPTPPEEQERVIPEERADVMIELMKKVVDQGTATRLRYQYDLRFDIAGKTGTSQNQSDGWFMGFTPTYVAGVWVGAESPSVHFYSMNLGQGSSSALPVWGLFMKKASKDPAFAASFEKSKFSPPCDSARRMLDCPVIEQDSLDSLDLMEEPIPVEDIEQINDRPNLEKKPGGNNDLSLGLLPAGTGWLRQRKTFYIQ